LYIDPAEMFCVGYTPVSHLFVVCLCCVSIRV